MKKEGINKENAVLENSKLPATDLLTLSNGLEVRQLITVSCATFAAFVAFLGRIVTGTINGDADF